MNEYILDGFEFKNREDAFKYIKEVMELPEYFGNNLDALWDVLEDFKDIKIKIVNARQIPRNLKSYGLKVLDIFGDVNGNRGIEVEIFW